MSLEAEYYAIIDTQKKAPRLCYAATEKTAGAMAIFDKKPKIQKEWQDVKKVVKVKITIL